MFIPMTTQSTTSLSSKIQVLLVEDNDINRLLMCDYLRYHGYHVVSLVDGEDFFETLDCVQPNIILLDLKLRETSGFHLLKKLQDHPIFQKIPVIVVSGLAFQKDKKRAFDLGARQYLVKPINLNELHNLIQEEVLRSRS
ncbi:MAG: response regulator [Oscillatoriales cyanobacterium C42_A2020_001]|nr:response regulator [Leptolyngbyaceae cyanobacterium C42_A2020_001]